MTPTRSQIDELVADLDESTLLSPPRETAGLIAYEGLVASFLERGDPGLDDSVTAMSREMAAQQVPLTHALATLWNTASPFLDAASVPGCLAVLRRALQAQHELAEAYDQAYQMDRRAHLRLTSAYAGKIREITTLLDNLPAFVFLKDLQFRYCSVNRLYCEALQRRSHDILGKTDSDFFAGETATKLGEHERRVLEQQELLTEELTVAFQGERRTVLFVKAPVIGIDGEVEGLIGVGFDLTDRKRAEAERDRLAAAVQSIADAVCITDRGGAIQYVNPAFEAITGFSRAEATGKNPRILKSDKHDADFYRAMWKTLDSGQRWLGTVINRRRDGSLFEADLSIAPLRGTDERVASYVAVMRDTTERQRMIDTLQRAVMVKSEFTSMVSHELRTPLTAIKEAIDVVEDETAGAVNENQKSFLNLAKRNVDRLHRLINDTLDFSRLERGEFRLGLKLHDLNEVVREVVEQQTLPAQKRGLEMRFDPSADLPPVPIDDDRISQVLVNLIGNAIRYCERGGIEVRTRPAGREVLVEVEDTGPGIPSDQLEQIFDAFVQLSSGPKRRAGGTGLGLAISKKIVELHGGRIWAESEPDRGSRFMFTLGTQGTLQQESGSGS